jgi:hypothetical protein
MAITGIDPVTFELVSGWDYVAKTLVPDALSTRVGTRVLQRELGARPETLLDKPANAATLAHASIAYAETLGQIVHRETGVSPIRFKGLSMPAIDREGVARIRVRIEDHTTDVAAEREIVR